MHLLILRSVGALYFTLLYCIVLCCVVLAILYCTVLCCAVLAVLHCTVLCCAVLRSRARTSVESNASKEIQESEERSLHDGI